MDTVLDKPTNRPKVRKPDYDLSRSMPKFWFKDNAIATFLNNTMHILFPLGERMFVRSVQRFAGEVTDPQLKEDIKGFIGQEMQHGKEHEKFHQTIRNQGYDIDTFTKIYETLAFKWFEPFVDKLSNGKLPLSMTAGLEHLTASMAETPFVEGGHEGVPEHIRELFTWHAIEEMEHKAVAFDVLQEVDDSYALRIGGYVLGISFFASMAMLGLLSFLVQERMPLAELREQLKAFPEKQKKVSGLLKKHMRNYFKRDFHPNDYDHDQFIAEGLRRLGMT